MNLEIDPNALEDLSYFIESEPSLAKKVMRLLKEIQKNPFNEIGNSEPLKHSLSGKWSRRINQEHRVIYEVKNNIIIIYQCRYHY